MKYKIKRMIIAVIFFSMIFGMTACGKKTSNKPSQPIAEDEPVLSETELAIEKVLNQYGEETEEEAALLETAVNLSSENVTALKEALSTVKIVYPYGDIVNMQDSYDRYLSMALWEDDTDYGALSRMPLKDGELFGIVKANNEEFLSVRTIANSLYSPLEDEYLEWVCQVLTNTFNRELDEWEFGAQLDSIDWTIANLKVIKGGAMDNASVTKGAIMQVRQSGVEDMVTVSGNDLASEISITHEAEHLLQCMSTPGLEALGVSQAYGFCYSWDDLPVNSLYTSWLVEASAEKLAAYFYDTESTTYATMIGYLDTLTAVAALRGVEPIELPRLTQQGTLDAVFELFGRETEEEKLELLNLLYAIQVIQQSPDDFWELYTQQTGLEKTEENLIDVQRDFKAAACLTMSRMFYENLAQLLEKNTITIRGLFYLVNTWEFAMNRHLGYDDEARLHNTGTFLEGYPQMQQTFLSILAENTGYGIEELTELYNAAHCRARVPKTSMLHGDEIWDAEDLAPFSREVNDFWDSYYQTVSQYKTAPIGAVSEILIEK